MKVRYFAETDTLYIVLREHAIAAAQDLGEHTLADSDADGHLCAITVESASQRTDVSRLDLDGIDR